MKEIIVESKKYGTKRVLLDDEDFALVSNYTWCVTNGRGTFYSHTKIKDKTVYMHRLILGLTDPKIPCDHIDHNGLNNQRNNIRACTQSQNLCNRSPNKNGSSKYLGVSWDKEHRKWKVLIHNKFLGRFNLETDAAKAYNKAAKEIHGEFANLNSIPFN